ncbi:MAG: DUF5916 domain-containing protein [Rhodothermaceae bacterium]
MRTKIFLFLILLGTLYSQEKNTMPEEFIYTTVKIDEPPKIDGIFTDKCWLQGKWEKFYFQREPNGGKAPTQETKFKILYDEKNIYAAFICYDKEPEKIASWLGERDQFVGDVVNICLDSYCDKRTSYDFGVTAGGAKHDVYISNGTEVNENWNPIFDVKVEITDSSWQAEFEIPFSQIRFNEKEEQDMRLHLWRWIYRNSEEDNWEVNPRSNSSWLEKYGLLKGIKGIDASRQIEIQPFFSYKTNFHKKEEGNPFRDGFDDQVDLGLDAKIGVSENMTLDLTVNPDFGQIEADPSKITLSAYEIRYDEKRPFFIEGKNFLSMNSIFYSRRIGQAPRYTPGVSTNEYVDNPLTGKIIAAAKLTGQTKNGLTIGILESVTGKRYAEVKSGDKTKEIRVEPLTNYFVARVQKNSDSGNLMYGGMITAVNRKIEDDHLDFLTESAYTGVADLIYRWDKKKYFAKATAIASSVRGSKEAITRVQKSSAHYYQRPDADYIDLDENLTSLNGYGLRVSAGKEGGVPFRYSTDLIVYSPGLELNDCGYLPEADVIENKNNLEYVILNQFGEIRNLSVELSQISKFNFGGQNTNLALENEVYINFTNHWAIGTTFRRTFPSISTTKIHGGPSIKTVGNWYYNLYLHSDTRKFVNTSLSCGYRKKDEGGSYDWSITPEVNVRFSESFNVQAIYDYSFIRENLQYVSTVDLTNQKGYLHGLVDQTYSSFSLRFSYHITPELSIRYYGNVFIANREYSEFKMITDPKAEKYEERFRNLKTENMKYDKTRGQYLVHDDSEVYSFYNPDMYRLNFNSNLVFRWEFNPGSTLYFVFSQSRAGNERFRQINFGDGASELFDIFPENIYMLKFNYWFSY